MSKKQVTAKAPTGEDIILVTLESGGYMAQISSFGANLKVLRTPDRNGEVRDIVLGFDNPLDNITSTAYFGQVVGRFANRIKGASFTLDGQTHSLDRNDGAHTLHSGKTNWGWRNWCVETFELEDGNPGAVYSLYSPAGEGGFPHAVNCTVTYLLKQSGQLVIDYEATCDGPTPINLTNHAYFNLKGAAGGTILDHELELFCDRYLEVDAQLIPTGKILQAAGGPLDFSKAKPIGRDIEAAGGYDHCFILTDESEGLKKVARVVEPKHGRVMDVETTLPAVQLYSGNFLNGSDIGKGGVAYERHAGFCLETQYYPDSVNNAHFPSAIFTKERPFKHTTVFTFSTVE
jgi:aldose 1-epimerase